MLEYNRFNLTDVEQRDITSVITAIAKKLNKKMLFMTEQGLAAAI